MNFDNINPGLLEELAFKTFTYKTPDNLFTIKYNCSGLFVEVVFSPEAKLLSGEEVVAHLLVAQKEIQEELAKKIAEILKGEGDAEEEYHVS